MQRESSLQCRVLSRATEGAIRACRENPKGRNRPSFKTCFPHFAASCLFPRESPIRSSARLLGWQGQRGDPLHPASKKSPHQVALGQRQPLMAGVLDRSATRPHQPLLQAGQRPPVHPRRQHPRRHRFPRLCAITLSPSAPHSTENDRSSAASFSRLASPPRSPIPP